MTDANANDFRDKLRTALHVERWVDDVAAKAPFSDLDSLVMAAYDAATPLTPAEIDEAVAAHPRIGEKPAGATQSAALSRSEQSAPDADDEQLAAAIAQGNADYEARFGRVFLIRAAGRTRAEVLSELLRRLELDDQTELEIVGEQLRDIALLRIETLFSQGIVAGGAA
ncbi:2-oxo-4-hydroxy-4-carboxy-5-ureidoimidazoline decarboxylase [Frondihabitans australicus]|uniref:2-oxo-4-hydroxy-4-carboxy-5-ureidoimidazoline decarboxylase n=1 Tax=Frondihabitans australicus TaxID=386892 RepID=A0A495ILK8_9MICO|nr:2-oxo-4-hydroxy-4-carboxy-5-ureidoimidazoline decarboxylase [Frondihabitans australicus]RKR76015.1 2-oxo-4-hydroxy-4-carboxy-5-ureidoimidazoline decarboxylase [Frondihabitans australicus]